MTDYLPATTTTSRMRKDRPGQAYALPTNQRLGQPHDAAKLGIHELAAHWSIDCLAGHPEGQRELAAPAAEMTLQQKLA